MTMKSKRSPSTPAGAKSSNETLLSRFLRYVQVGTQSNEFSPTCPSTPSQLVLQRMLYDELKLLGASEVKVTDHGYVLATIPAKSRKVGIPTIAFLAHVDTAPDFSGDAVKPIVHRNYDGLPIRFPDNRKLVLDTTVAPELAQAKGKDIVTASGLTLLGADDKAGVAAIMTAVDYWLRHPGAAHGKIRICFTPDEEIGRGVEKLDLAELGADVAYTLDGHSPGEICWETFSADAAVVTIEGVSTHPGEAKAKGMVNALHLAGKLLAALPREHCAPETTGGREGFIHPVHFEGRAEKAVLKFILRDFDLAGLAAKRAILNGLCRGLQASEVRASVRCKITKQYRNMAYWLRKDMRPVEMAREAIRNVGLQPADSPIRGGTDGSRLTERGLPCPNLFCGMNNVHGPLEWVAVQDMELAARTCVRLAEVWEEQGATKPKRSPGRSG
jgi:tripeptide aminopeptidase